MVRGTGMQSDATARFGYVATGESGIAVGTSWGGPVPDGPRCSIEAEARTEL
jgi:hypothetical protein